MEHVEEEELRVKHQITRSTPNMIMIFLHHGREKEYIHTYIHTYIYIYIIRYSMLMTQFHDGGAEDILLLLGCKKRSQKSIIRNTLGKLVYDLDSSLFECTIK